MQSSSKGCPSASGLPGEAGSPFSRALSYVWASWHWCCACWEFHTWPPVGHNSVSSLCSPWLDIQKKPETWKRSEAPCSLIPYVSNAQSSKRTMNLILSEPARQGPTFISSATCWPLAFECKDTRGHASLTSVCIEAGSNDSSPSWNDLCDLASTIAAPAFSVKVCIYT